MDKQNIVIIGASSGIGLKSMEMLAEQGHEIFATYRSSKPEEQKANVRLFELDVNMDVHLPADLPAEIHGLVYCPGAIYLKPFHRIKPETFEEDYHLQVIGAIKMIQALLPRLKASGSASIVLFSTVAVQRGFNFHSLVSASKGAIEGLTRTLAAEFAPGIRVNCIAPSLTDTPLAAKLLSTPEKRENNAQRHPLKRVGESSDIASAVTYLLSPAAEWITGQVLKIDGGMSTIVQ